MHRTVALLMVILLAVGCGPQPEQGGITQATAGPQPSSVAEAAGTPQGAGGRGGAANRVALPGLPPGPAAPDTPPPYRWYLALQTGQCAGLSDTATDTSLPEVERVMFASLAQVCRLLGGEPGAVDWTAAQAALDGSADVTGCLEVAARKMLASAVDAHRADPQAVLVRGQAEGGTACPVTITSAVMTDPSTIVLTGDYLIDPSEVRVAGQTVAVQFDGAVPGNDQALSGQVSVPLPEGLCASVGDVLGVEVAGPGYDARTDVTVPDLGQGSCASPSGTPSTAPSASG